MSSILSWYIYPFVLIVSVVAFSGFFKEFRKYSFIGISSVFILTIFLLVLRDPLAPADSVNYIWMYNQQNELRKVLSAYHGNYFFSFTQYIGNVFGLSVEAFLIFQTILFFLVTLIGLRLIFDSNRMLLMAFSFFVLTSTFILLYTNVVRQGLALSLVILSIGLFIRSYRFLGYLSLILAIFSHFSAIIVALIFFVTRSIPLNKNIGILIFFLPVSPFFSDQLLSIFLAIGGIFQKIESFSEKEYDNSLVYIKVGVIYFSLILFYFMGKYRGLFLDSRYKFIFYIYLILVAVILFTLPVLLLSSRFLYYASALLPILYVFVLFHRRSLINLKVRVSLSMIITLLFGVFVYGFRSVRMQLGI